MRAGHQQKGETVIPIEKASATGMTPPERLPRYEEPSYRFMKRGLDIVLGVIGLIVLFPVFLLASLAVITGDGFPVFYWSERVGLNGKRFRMLKFRTMVRNADEVLRRDPVLFAEYQKNLKLKNDPRLIRFGDKMRSLSIDELPQLLNVVKGEMSLVGPRPILPPEWDRYGDSIEFYLRMKPSCAGLWQCEGRSELEFEERVRLDRQYYYEASIRQDLRIIGRTLGAILKRKGAY